MLRWSVLWMTVLQIMCFLCSSYTEEEKTFPMSQVFHMQKHPRNLRKRSFLVSKLNVSHSITFIKSLYRHRRILFWGSCETMDKSTSPLGLHCSQRAGYHWYPKIIFLLWYLWIRWFALKYLRKSEISCPLIWDWTFPQSIFPLTWICPGM